MRSLSLRIFLGWLIAAVAVGGALAVSRVTVQGSAYTYKEKVCKDAFSQNCPETGRTIRAHHARYRPTWAEPLALGLLIAGIGAGAAFAASGLRFRIRP